MSLKGFAINTFSDLTFGETRLEVFSLAPSTSRKWTVGGNLNVARRFLAGAGTQIAGLSFGGSTIFGVVSNTAEEYNGAAWANGGNLNTALTNLAGCGSWSSALSIGGNALGNATDMTEKYS